MTPRTKPDYFHSFLLASGLLIVLAASCISCYSGVVYTEQPTQGHSIVDQYENALRVSVKCALPSGGIVAGGGSAVMLTSTTALTAYHVVDCPGNTLIRLTDKSGEEYRAVVVASNPGTDVAKLHVIDDSFKLFKRRTVIGQKPYLGQEVCVLSAWPNRNARCGKVQLYESAPGDLEHTAFTEPGNSGGGVYDVNGRLVAIVTHLRFCGPSWSRQICGGKAATLWDETLLRKD